jgi:predicted metal-dependent enzyme (double-stranded beta helix superfamily)
MELKAQLLLGPCLQAGASIDSWQQQLLLLLKSLNCFMTTVCCCFCPGGCWGNNDHSKRLVYAILLAQLLSVVLAVTGEPAGSCCAHAAAVVPVHLQEPDLDTISLTKSTSSWTKTHGDHFN